VWYISECLVYISADHRSLAVKQLNVAYRLTRWIGQYPESRSGRSEAPPGECYRTHTSSIATTRLSSAVSVHTHLDKSFNAHRRFDIQVAVRKNYATDVRYRSGSWVVNTTTQYYCPHLASVSFPSKVGASLPAMHDPNIGSHKENKVSFGKLILSVLIVIVN